MLSNPYDPDPDRIVVPEDLPWCNRCGKPVDRLDVLETHGRPTTFVAICHGEREVVELPSGILEVSPGKIRFAPAFSTPQALPRGRGGGGGVN